MKFFFQTESTRFVTVAECKEMLIKMMRFWFNVKLYIIPALFVWFKQNIPSKNCNSGQLGEG